MKKILIILALLTVFFHPTYADENVGEASTSSLLVGKWATVGGSVTYQFLEDGTYTYYGSYGSRTMGKWYVEGNALTLHATRSYRPGFGKPINQKDLYAIIKITRDKITINGEYGRETYYAK